VYFQGLEEVAGGFLVATAGQFVLSTKVNPEA
jgi:hypothetical protein